MAEGDQTAEVGVTAWPGYGGIAPPGPGRWRLVTVLKAGGNGYVLFWQRAEGGG